MAAIASNSGFRDFGANASERITSEITAKKVSCLFAKHSLFLFPKGWNFLTEKALLWNCTMLYANFEARFMFCFQNKQEKYLLWKRISNICLLDFWTLSNGCSYTFIFKITFPEQLNFDNIVCNDHNSEICQIWLLKVLTEICCFPECPEKLDTHAYSYQDSTFPLDCMKI